MERIPIKNKPYNRLEALERLGKSGCRWVIWKIPQKEFEVHWGQIRAIGRPKHAVVCAETGKVLRSNQRGMTVASVDVRIRVLLDIYFRDHRSKDSNQS